MAIASGLHYQTTRKFATGVAAASFLFAGVAPDEEFLKQGGSSFGSAHHRDGVQALQATTRDIILEAEDVPPFGAQLISPEVHREAEPAQTFTLEANLRDDVSPELYRRIIHEALLPRPVEHTWTWPAEDIDDIRLETRRWLIQGEVQPEIPPQSYLHFEPIDNAPADPDQFATTRQLVVEAEIPRPAPYSYTQNSEDIEDIRLETRRWLISPEQHGRIPPQSITHFEPIDDAVAEDAEFTVVRRAVHQALIPTSEPPPSATFGEVFEENLQLLHFRWYYDDNADEDATTAIEAEDQAITTGLNNSSLHLRVKVANEGNLANQHTWRLEFDLDDAGSWTEVTGASNNIRYIDGQPAQGATTSERLTSQPLAYELGRYEETGGGTIKTLANQAETEFVHSIEVRFADFGAERKVTFRMVTDLSGTVTNVVTPTLYLFEPAADKLTHQAEQPRRSLLSWIHDGQVPDAAAVDNLSFGTGFASAHHREQHVIPQSRLFNSEVPEDFIPPPRVWEMIREPARPKPEPAPSWLWRSIVPDTERSVRYIQVVPYPDYKNHPNFRGIEFMSWTHPGTIEFLPVVTHYRFFDDDDTNVNTTTALEAEDTQLTVDPLDAVVHLRLVVSNKGGEGRTADYQLQYDRNASGTWTDVNATSGVARTTNGQPADGDATTQRLTAELAAFDAGKYDDVDGITDGIVQTSQADTELVFAFTFRSLELVSGDTVTFRLREETSGFTARAVPADVTPSATIPAPLLDKVLIYGESASIIFKIEDDGVKIYSESPVSILTERNKN